MEKRVVSNDDVNEARRYATLGAVTTATWQGAKERLNKHEKLFLNVADGDVTSISKIRERFGEWLNRDHDKRLTKKSVSTAAVDEALDKWGVASITELDAIEERHRVIEEDYDGDAQQAFQEVPVPSKLCAKTSIVEMVTESSARQLSSLDDLDDWDPTSTNVNLGESLEGMQTEVSTNEAMEIDLIVEAVQPTPPTESVVSAVEEVTAPPVPDVVAMGETVQGPGDASGATPVARISLGKAQLQALAAIKPPVGRMKAQEIDCPIVKRPAALLMQNVEGFLLITGQRNLWLGSRRKQLEES